MIILEAVRAASVVLGGDGLTTALSITSVALPAAGLAGGLVLLGAGTLVLRRGRVRTDVL